MKRLMYVGTYTSSGKSEGIYICRFDEKNGGLEILGHSSCDKNPSFLSLSRCGGFLYSARETGENAGIKAFKANKKTGELTFINERSFPGSGTCYLRVSNNRKWITAANYNSGNVFTAEIKENGGIGEMIENCQHRNEDRIVDALSDTLKTHPYLIEVIGMNNDRQSKPHAHCAALDSKENFMFAADLGTDGIHVYETDPLTGGFQPHMIKMTPTGEGPRHIIFDKDSKHAYLVTELGSKVFAYDYDKKNGYLDETICLSTLPEDWEGENYSADIHLSPDGKFLYCSNRGHDSIACFQLDGLNTECQGFYPTGGKTPRNFTVTDNHIICANQDSDNITVFKRDAKTGALSKKTAEAEIPSPACIELGYGEEA